MTQFDQWSRGIVSLDTAEQRVAMCGEAVEIIHQFLALSQAAAHHGLHLMHSIGQLKLLKTLHCFVEACGHVVSILCKFLHGLCTNHEKKTKQKNLRTRQSISATNVTFF